MRRLIRVCGLSIPPLQIESENYFGSNQMQEERRGVVSIAMKYAHVQNRKKARVGFDEGDDILIFEV